MEGIPAPVYAALAALMMAATAVLQEWLRSKREKEAAEKVAAQVAEVKTALVEKDVKTDAALEDIKKTGDAVHILVNNSMRLALESIAKLTREKSDASGDDVDIAAADDAADKLSEHMGRQAKVDKGETN